MESLYEPDANLSLSVYFNTIGTMTCNVEPWKMFHDSIVRTCGTTTVGQLKLMRSNDIDTALSACGMSNGFKTVLSSYLVRHGATPFVFGGDVKLATQTDSKTYAKKYNSQAGRPSLGNELGPAEVSKLKFPPGLFTGIACGQGVPMKGKGKHSTEAVANRVWAWAVAQWGNLHVDHIFLEHMETLLDEKWPKLKPWGGKDRVWYTIIKNRFGNAREAGDKAYAGVEIPGIDMTSPAKRLLQERELNIKVNEEMRSMFDVVEEPTAPTAGQEAQEASDVATGHPVSFSGSHIDSSFFVTGVHVAQGVAAGSSAPPADPHDSSADPPPYDSSSNMTANDSPADSPGDNSHADPAPPPKPRRHVSQQIAHDSSDDENAHAPAPPPNQAANPPKPPRQPPAKRQRREVPPPAPDAPFAESRLATDWSTLSRDEAAAVGNSVADPDGLGNPELNVAKIFPLKDGTRDWYIGTINTSARPSKKHFWATFVDDGAEYRMPYFPKGYGTEWYLVRVKTTPLSPDY